MRTVEEALALIEEAAGEPRRRVEHVPVADGGGRVLAEDVRMDHDVPPFRRATMDGFAVRAADLRAGARLDVVARIVAGAWPEVTVGPGEAARVMTGAPLPEGADAVAPFEWTTTDGETVTLESVGAGPNVAERGAHMKAGAVVLAAGTVLTPAALGALATAGAARVPVAARPVVAVLGTGSELVPVDAAPGPGAIRNSNGAALAGQIRRAGAVPLDLGIAPDAPDRLAAKIAEGLRADLLLLSGGVSKGDLDLVPRALAEAGVTEVFHRWRVQPGGPLWFGRRDATLVFGLPGNPAATFTGFEVAVVPALATRVGRPFAPRRRLRARLEGEPGRAGARRRYRPVTLDTEEDGTLVATPLPWRGSGDPFALAAAEALAVIPEDRAPPADGVLDVLPVAPWGGLP